MMLLSKYKIAFHLLFLLLIVSYTGGFSIPAVRGHLTLTTKTKNNNIGKTSRTNRIFAIADLAEINEEEAWECSIDYDSETFSLTSGCANLLDTLKSTKSSSNEKSDLENVLWELCKKEAEQSIQSEIQAGPFLYQFILSQPNFIDAIVNFIANEIATELMPATSICNLFHQTLQESDIVCVHLDAVAASMRKNDMSVLIGVLFNKGLHALVCHRVSHRLWKQGRYGLAYYIQSTISSKYSADIHPAAQIGQGIYLNSGKGIVIGETAVIGNDVTILQGVTLGGTGKERGDRHPKIGNGVVLYDGATVLGNIVVGDGAVVTAKSIVTKAVPPFARVSGIPAKVKSFRNRTYRSEEK